MPITSIPTDWEVEIKYRISKSRKTENYYVGFRHLAHRALWNNISDLQHGPRYCVNPCCDSLKLATSEWFQKQASTYQYDFWSITTVSQQPQPQWCHGCKAGYSLVMTIPRAFSGNGVLFSKHNMLRSMPAERRGSAECQDWSTDIAVIVAVRHAKGDSMQSNDNQQNCDEKQLIYRKVICRDPNWRTL
jgi:hypothetical protein